MSNKYEVEVLLRPPVELCSAVVAAFGVFAAIEMPSILMMTPNVAYVSAAVLALIALQRGRQAAYILRYQRNLKRTPRYSLSASQIPVSQKGLFLGKGFRWTQKHTERVYAARDKHAEKYVQPHPFTRWVRHKELQWEHSRFLSHFTRLTAKDSAFNPLRPPPPTGGEPLLHGVGIDDETDVYMPLSDRPGHTVVIARTRHGKTRFAETLITQDIHRKERNCVVVIDPKNDADLLKRTYVEAKKAGREIYIIHLGYPELSARYNSIGSFSRITEPATRLTNGVASEGEAKAFKDFAWQYVNIIVVSLFALGEQPDYLKIRRYISDIDPLFVRYAQHWLHTNGPENWQSALAETESKITPTKLNRTEQGRDVSAVALVRYLKQLDVFDPVLEGLISAFRFEKEYFQKITGAVKPLLEKLTTGNIAEILAPDLTNMDDDRPVLEWLQAIRQGAVVYVGLDALTDPEVAEVYGQSIFSDLTSLAGRIYKHGIDEGLPTLNQTAEKPKIIIHGDEFSDLIGPQFKTLINKAGGAGYQLTLYTQTWSDPIAELGDRAKAGQLAGNIGTMIMMGVKEKETCEMFTLQLPEVNVSDVMAVSSATDASNFDDGINFVSQNQDRMSVERVPMISPADIVALPKGQAFVMLNGSEAWKIRIPMPSKADDAELPDDLSEMLMEMRESYTSVMDWSSYKGSLELGAFAH